ncbi:uncharacterized protein BJ171DRAFT_436772 [Polychytrium aggregatum]|uniref:uncharacterized protein n=1 Tax=Polychytrium aggregatum TaxID=110093 RepID=UPI0022FEF861|nr:uncharacterized protein BJ171DRAFT_436772 [Polychytrium aggregatum]KAI9209619.1 hypothetical protein BJ171DRAFT_436772 [Polychytrium aggregatum]
MLSVSRGFQLLVALVPLGWMAYMAQGRIGMNMTNSLSPMDIYYIAFALSPLVVLCVSAVLLDNPAADALYKSSSKTRSSSRVDRFLHRIWKPRWQVFKGRFADKSYVGNPWSTAELAILVLLVLFNLAWIFVPIIIRMLPSPGRAPRVMNLYRWVRSIGVWTAYAGLWDAGLCVLFAIRENAVMKNILGKDAGQYHRVIRFHIGLGYASFVMVTIHSLYFIIDFLYNQEFFEEMFPWLSNGGYENFYGFLSWLALIAMIITSVYKIRRSRYNVFYWTHQLYFVYFFCAWIHMGSYCIYPVIGPCIYLIYDRLRPRLGTKTETMAVIRKTISDSIIELTIPIGSAWRFTSIYAPGDWVNIQVPQISNFQQHPFSIASYCLDTPNAMVLYIKANGAWTQKLSKLIAEHEDRVEVPIRVDGPFGSRSTDYLNLDHLVIVAGGSGMGALMPYILHYSIAGSASGKLTLVWTAKKESDILAYASFVRELADESSLLHKRVDLHLHITRSEAVVSDTPATPGSPNDSELKEKQSLGLICDTPRVIKSPRPLAVRWLSIRDRSGEIALAVMVFGFAVLGWYLGIRLNLTGPAAQKCSAKTAFKLTGLDHFLCWYFMPAGSPVLSILLALVGGLATTACANILRSRRSATACSTLSAESDETLNGRYSSEMLAAVPPSIYVHKTRPDFATLFQTLGLEEAGAKSQVAVMAAGPERLMRHLQSMVSSSKNIQWYRESWKV